MTLALRAHHLLCMLTYAGRGYSPDFVRNFDHMNDRTRRSLGSMTGAA